MSDTFDFSLPDPASVGLPTPDFSIAPPPSFDPGGFSLPPISAPVAPVTGSFADTLRSIANSITGAAQTYYGTAAQLNQLRAQQQIANAQNRNAVATAQTGFPSPYLLLFAGLGLAALVVVTRK